MEEFSAYFDDSGKQNSADGQLVVCGGAVSSAKRWGKLSSEWTAELKAKNLEILHMNTLRRELPDPDERAVFTERLAEIITAYTIVVVWGGVLWRDWDALDAKYRLRETVGTPFPFAAFAAVAHVAHWANKPKRNVPMNEIEFWLERGADGKGILDNLVMKEWGTEVHSGSKSLQPLQVADFIAWHVRRWGDYTAGFDDRKASTAFSILSSAPNSHGFYGRQQMQELIDLIKIPRRGGENG